MLPCCAIKICIEQTAVMVKKDINHMGSVSFS